MDLNGISSNLLLIGFVLVSLCCLYLLFSNFSKTREIEEMKRKVEDLKNIFFNQQKHNDESFAKMINLIQHQSLPSQMQPDIHPMHIEPATQQLKTVTISTVTENELPTNIIINKEQSDIQTFNQNTNKSENIATPQISNQAESECKEVNIDLEELNDLDEPSDNNDIQDITDLDDIDNIVQLDDEENENTDKNDMQDNSLEEHIKNGIFATSAKIEIFDDNISISTEPIENLDDVMQNETNIDDLDNLDDLDNIKTEDINTVPKEWFPMTANVVIAEVNNDHHLLGHLDNLDNLETPTTSNTNTSEPTETVPSEITNETKTIIIDSDNTLDNIIITDNQSDLEENTKTIFINGKKNNSNIEELLDDNLEELDDLDKLLSGNNNEPKQDDNTSNTKKNSDLSSMSIKQLKELAKTHKLKTTGTKNDLIAALSKVINN